ncbi:NAD-dependent epimerase/dehydratase family protein [Phytohabitans kaempferiae]|uniref:NAD-dependent epimerase/dehydratase family protein n=1 Tax=Phytohabitans kaempferiae TaxID=1620943 RepID=A0ABV6M6N2_9ACTN
MRVLVTGAAGRVGANVVRRLVEADVAVTAMVLPGDRQAAKLAPLTGVRVIEADLGDQAAVDAACAGATHIVHLAAQLVRGDTPVDRFYDINAFGTLRLLEGALRTNGGIERFVLASTDGTYRPGDPPAVPLREDAPQEPADYYGTSKLLGEVILRNHAAQFDIPYSMVRFATVVSPEEAAGYFRLDSARAMLRRADLGRDSNIWQLFRGRPDLLPILDTAAGDAPPDAAVGLVGPDGHSWSLHMVDVRDAVQGVHLALTEPDALGGVFNIAAAEPTTWEHGAAVLAELFDVPKLSVAMPFDWRLEVTVDAARERLGYQPRYDFRATVQEARATASGVAADFIPARV